MSGDLLRRLPSAVTLVGLAVATPLPVRGRVVGLVAWTIAPRFLR